MEFDSVHISQAAQMGQPVIPPPPSINDGSETLKLKEDVEKLSRQLEMILQRLDNSGLPYATKPEEAPKEKNDKFEPGLLVGQAGQAGQAEKLDKADDIEPSPPLSLAPQVPMTLPFHEPLGEMEDTYQQLVSAEVEPRYAVSLVKEYQEEKPSEPFVKWMETKIKCAGSGASGALGGKRVMLLGPTGAGKTTTIAKLAAIHALWEHKSVLLLTSDTYRIAAVEQLRTYAKILGVPLEVIFEVENFAPILAEHEDADLVLLDTAGRGQKDRKNLEAFEALYSVFKPDAVHLVLAANMKYKDILDVLDRMSGVPISHIIFTKLDETVSYGSIFNVIKSFDRPVSFFTTGQNVPNDIEVASGARLTGLLMGDEVRSAAQ